MIRKRPVIDKLQLGHDTEVPLPPLLANSQASMTWWQPPLSILCQGSGSGSRRQLGGPPLSLHAGEASTGLRHPPTKAAMHLHQPSSNVTYWLLKNDLSLLTERDAGKATVCCIFCQHLYFLTLPVLSILTFPINKENLSPAHF